jgi:hypothetical protein
MTRLVVPARFNGPPASGNGGYVAGALAAELAGQGPDWEQVTVQLRLPPPLERALDVVRVEGRAELRDGDEVVAVALPEEPGTWTSTEPVDLSTARGLEASYAGHRAHPFPTCFSCGPRRRDGLRIFPGRVDDSRVASSWTPAADAADGAGKVAVPVTWAALDCVGGWSSDIENRPMVLGQIAARVQSPPQAGTPYVVVGTWLRTEGRRTWAASAMFDPDGRLVAQAEQLWFEVDWAVVHHLQEG